MTLSIMLQLAYQFPQFLVLLIAAILALMHLGRCPGASALTLSAVGLWFVTSIGKVVLQNWLIFGGGDMGFRQGQNAQMLTLVAIVGSVLQAVALGLLVAAIFAGRQAKRLPDN